MERVTRGGLGKRKKTRRKKKRVNMTQVQRHECACTTYVLATVHRSAGVTGIHYIILYYSRIIVAKASHISISAPTVQHELSEKSWQYLHGFKRVNIRREAGFRKVELAQWQVICVQTVVWFNRAGLVCPPTDVRMLNIYIYVSQI